MNPQTLHEQNLSQRERDRNFVRALAKTYPKLVPNPPANDVELTTNQVSHFKQQCRKVEQSQIQDIQALREASYQWKGTLGDSVLSAVANAFRVAVSDLTGPHRCQLFIVPRWVCIRLLRDITWESGEPRFSYPMIGRMLKRDHSSILHAIQNFDVKMKQYPEAAKVYETLSAQMRGGNA